MKEIKASLDASVLRVAIVCSRFNDLIGERLIKGAHETLLRHGAKDENIQLVMVPGAFELPLALKKLAETGRYDALIALGAVIRGATPHFDYVAGVAAKGIGAVALSQNIPIAFGLLTCDSVEQALDRAGLKVGNKGVDAALSAIEMANFMKTV